MALRQTKCKIGNARYSLRSDDGYLKRIGRVFEPKTVRLLQALVEPDTVALDVGANIGCTSILLSQTCRSVHAFEPSPTTFGLLKDNMAANDIDNVTLHNCGLGGARFETTLTFAPDMRAGAYVSNKMQASAGHVVENVHITDGDSCLAESGIDGPVGFMKIDVEGFELEVISGLENTIASYSPVVCLELNHWCLNVFQRITVPDFLDRLLEVFPVLLAVDAKKFADLRNDDHKYHVMNRHLLKRRFPNLVAAFDYDRLDRFSLEYSSI